MTTPTLEDKLRAQWRELPRATRWKLVGGVTIVFNSLAAQVFFVWLYARARDTTKPMLFGSFPWPPLESLWKGLLGIVFDDARHTQAVNALALNILAWSLWVAWLVWRATKRPNIENSNEYSMSQGSSGDAL